jgi:alanine racemase
MHSFRPIRAEISLAALKHNYALAKKLAPHSQAFAVVKANAYGHGLERVARALGDADGFATLELDSAIKLRDLGIRSPILMLEGFFDEKELPYFSRHDLMPVIRDMEQMQQLAAADLTRPLDIFLKFNTGMNRLGLAGGAAGFAINTAASHRNIDGVTLMTHFATADDKLGITAQLRHFEDIAKTAKSIFKTKSFTQSLANSASLLRFPETHRDWVRPGIMLYGSSPFADRDAHSLGLRPVMALRSEVIAVQSLEAGDAVGYGATFVAQKKMRVGIVACGYADGYPRHAPGTNALGTPVIVSGKRTRTIGRVSMDMLAVDITDMPHVHRGAPVTLWGEGLSVDEVAAAACTISYELFCGISARVLMVEVD